MDRTELRLLLENATKGKWRLEIDEYEGDGDEVSGQMLITGLNRVMHDPEWAEPDEWKQSLANAEFIAAAHNSLPALLDQLDALEAEVARLDWLASRTAQMDRLAAEKIMGWKRHPIDGAWLTDWDGKQGHVHLGPFLPTTKWDHAWMVVEKMGDGDWNLTLTCDGSGTTATFADNLTRNRRPSASHEARNGLAPMAITAAALLACGLATEEEING